MVLLRPQRGVGPEQRDVWGVGEERVYTRRGTQAILLGQPSSGPAALGSCSWLQQPRARGPQLQVTWSSSTIRKGTCRALTGMPSSELWVPLSLAPSQRSQLRSVSCSNLNPDQLRVYKPPEPDYRQQKLQRCESQPENRGGLSPGPPTNHRRGSGNQTGARHQARLPQSPE